MLQRLLKALRTVIPFQTESLNEFVCKADNEHQMIDIRLVSSVIRSNIAFDSEDSINNHFNCVYFLEASFRRDDGRRVVYKEWQSPLVSDPIEGLRLRASAASLRILKALPGASIYIENVGDLAAGLTPDPT